MSKVLWQASIEFIEQSKLKNYELWLKETYGLEFKNAEDLWQWSVDQYDYFWESIWEYFEIIHDGSYDVVSSSTKMPGIRWFEGTRLNYAEHSFRHANESRDALIFVNENRTQRISWNELQAKAAALQNALKNYGVTKGDCVVAYLPNIPEAIIAFLAVSSLGAIWSCCSPDFGVNTVVERFEQIKPKVLIGVDGYQYNAISYDRKSKLKAIADSLDESLGQKILVSYLDENSALDGFDSWNAVLETSREAAALEFVRVGFNDPLWVLYSSGTTGKPKAITHSHGGVLLEHLKYLSLHNDVKEGENFFWFSTTGWMMWNFLQATLLVGATPVLYDGSPGYPDLNILWRLAEELPIHHFGTSAPYLIACMKKSLRPGKEFDLSPLRSIGSTGAPLPSTAFEWVYDSISKEVWLCSMSGGTDVCTAFVGGHPYQDVRSGRIQCRTLGCGLFAYNEMAEKVFGSLGEMVVETPMPSMPIYFWNDEEMKRYRSSYFESYPDVWCHGDWIKLYADGSLSIHGRSDATLNRKGVRIGTSEIYTVLDRMEGIRDALILNIEQKDGSDFMPLFVVLEESKILDDEIRQSINQSLRKECSPRHVPDRIFSVREVPYTLSGKKMEVPLKKIFMGMDVSNVMNKDAMRNPESLLEYIEIAKSL